MKTGKITFVLFMAVSILLLIGSDAFGIGGPEGNANYTTLWNQAQPAVNFTEISLFNFLGAPYVARGPGCGFSDFNQYNNNSMAQPGKGCNSNNMENPGQPGSIALDLGAVWASQNSENIAWNIIGPFIVQYNLSVCGGTPNSNAGYVIEFNADDNTSTGCIGNPQSGEGCYPGSDYQIWYFPDTHKSLFAYYNGTMPTADGRPANSGNCTRNPGEVCFVANTSVDVAINVTCNLNLGGLSNAGQNGLIIVLNKSYLPANPKLSFETNSFNTSVGTPGPIDQLTDKGVDKFIFMGPSMDAGSCYRYDMTNSSACTNNAEGFKCRWEQMDPMNPSKGACKPDFQKFETGAACFTYNNSAECLASTLGNCQWMDDPFAREKSANHLGLCVEQFRPMEFGGSGSCDTSCFDCYTTSQCNNSNANGGKTYGGCQWYNDTFNPQGWCDVKGMKFGCAQTPFDCHAQSECESSNWAWNSTWNVCLKDNTTEICFNGQDDNGNGLADCQDTYCKDTAKFCGANIDTLTGDYKGMSPQEAQMIKLVGMSPNIINLGLDNTTDSLSPINESTELYGFSVVVANLGLGMGIDMKNGTELKACDGPLSDRKYMYMIDKDANISTGCPITLDSTVYNGYDYMVKYGNYIAINSTTNNTKQMYACYNGTWTMKDATVIGVTTPAGGPGGPGGPGQPQGSNQPLECGDPMAPQMPGMASSHAAVVVEKADIGNPKNDMRFLVFVVNGSWDNTSSLLSYDKMEDIYYTPGTIGFQPVDCFKEPTKCGTEFMMIGGGKFMPFEDCIRPDDEDLDGFVNCDDSDCMNAPQCAGQYNASNDKTAPKVKMSKIDTFEDAAFAMWSTNEPTNATIELYDDSSCAQLNRTIWDEGMQNNPTDDFKPWHNIPLNEMSLDYLLESNTTYYYKLKSTDKAGNPSKSTCLNFTTEADPKNLSVLFDFVPQGDPTDFMGNMTINIDGQPMTLGNYSDKQNMDNVNITFENPTADPANNWSIEFVGASLFQDVSLNFSDSFLANDTGDQGKLLGIQNEEWLDAAQNLGIDYAILKIPSEGDKLYHCQDNGTSCMDVTNYEGVKMLDNGTGYTEWKIPTTLGFSSYSVGSGENATNYTMTFANITTSYVAANTDTNKTIEMNITNMDNVSRIYNFTIEKPINTSAWLNGSIQLDEVNMSAGGSLITNLTVNANASGTYSFNIIAKLSTNETIVLNSSDDLSITLVATTPDTTPPLITITSPGNTSYPANVWFNTTLSETGSSCAYSLDSAANATMSGSATTWYAQNTSMSAGSHTAAFYCNDTSGNMNTTSVIFTVDTTRPVITIILPTNTTYNTTSRIINMTAVDTNTDRCWYNYNSINTSIANCLNTTFTALDNQQSTLTIYANDSVGNLNSTSVTFTVDTAKPVISINLPANTSYNSVSRTINITVTDTNTDTCWYNYNGTNTIISNCVNATFTALDNQPSTLTIYANDTVGNVNSTAVVFTIDTLGPVISITSPLSASYSTSAIWFNVTLSETGSWCAYSLDNNVNITMNGSSTNWYALNASMSDDTHSATFYCNDTLGNMNTTSVGFPFFIDTTPAIFTNYARYPQTPNEDENVQLNVTLSEPAINITLEWNGTANYTVTEFSDYEYYITMINGTNYTAHDTVTYRWYAYDLLGNGNISATQSFTVANQIPAVTEPSVNSTAPQTDDVISCENGTYSDNDTEDSSETSRQYLWYDTGSLISNQTAAALSLSVNSLDKSDAITCSIRVSDGYNWSSWINSTNNATIQNTAPTAPTLSTPANNTNTSDSTPTFTWTASTDSDSDAVTYAIEIANDTGFTNINQSDYALSPSNYTATYLADGRYYWQVKAITSDANTTYTSFRTFTVDTVAPTFNAPSPSNDSRTNTDITLSASDSTSGLASIKYSINGTANVTSATIPLTSLTENITTTIDAYAEDYAGNVNHVSYTYTKDTTAPVITIISPTNETIETTNSTTLNYTISEEPRAIWYVVDNTLTALSNTTTSVQLNFTNVTGKHVIYLYANDSVGNLRTATTSVKLDTPFNMSNFVDTLGTLLGGITTNITGNETGDITNNETASLNQILNMTMNATVAVITFENFNGLEASWGETFNINTTNTTVEDMIKSYGTNTTKMIHIKQLENFLESGRYNGTVTFGPDNSSAYTDIIYCSDDNAETCSRIGSCINNSFNGTACYVDRLTNITIHVPHFSTVVLGTDTIPPVISIDEPVATETNGWNISVNSTVTEDTTACNYTINSSSISDIAMAGTSTTQYSAITSTFLPNGDYNITIACTDGNSNPNATSKLFTVADDIKPIISGISASVTSASATITWTTSEKADAKVNRGTNSTLLGTYTNNTENTTSHSVSLSSLSSSTTYYYNVTSCDAANNCNTTGPNTFTTSASSSASSSGGSSAGSSSSGGAAAPAPKKENKTKETKPKEDKKPEDTGSATASNRPKLIPGVGLRDNEKLQAAIEKVLAKGKMGDIARENMLKLSESISGQIDTERTFESTATTSKVTTKMKYNGKNKAKNFVVYEKIPKAFAASSDEITVTTSGKVEVVEKDPEYAILFQELNPGQTIEISYTINAKAEASVIDAMSSEVYAESIVTPVVKKTTTPPAQKSESGPSALAIIAIIVLIVIAVVLMSKNAKKTGQDKKDSTA